MADVPGKFYRATKVRTGVSPSSPGAIEGEVTPPLNPPGGGLNSVGLTMPSAFNVANSPLTSNGTLAVTGAGTVGQYIRGDGSLADFPQASGGGSSVSYYLNGSVNQGTIGGVAYRELSKVPILGAGTQFTINADGYIAQFLTDAGDPNLLEIPGGNWNFETYFSASSGGGTPTFYVELYKYNGTTFTLIASSSTSPEFIAFGTNLTPYYSTLAVPTTTLALTDRLAVRYYVTHSGRTITMHTENNTLCQIVTTFTTGITALNGLTAQVQNFAVGTSGTDFNISSATATHTFNLPTASATNRGALSSADWIMFNAKQPAGNYVTLDTSQTITGVKTFSQDIMVNAVNVGRGASSVATNTRLGFQTLVFNTTGSSNTSVGWSSLYLNTTGSANSSFGTLALENNTTGTGNTSSGYASLRNNTIGGANTATGYVALSANTTGNANTATGAYALENNTTGGSNTAVGCEALETNTTGGNNTAVGFQALRSNTGNGANTAVGNLSLWNNTAGLNTALGHISLYSNTTGEYNVGLGIASLYNNTTGSYNIAIGDQSGQFISGGGNNIISNNSLFIGTQTRALGNNQTNQIVIGHYAIGNGSNTVTIGNDSITTTFLKGNISLKGENSAVKSIQYTNPSGTLHWSVQTSFGAAGEHQPFSIRNGVLGTDAILIQPASNNITLNNSITNLLGSLSGTTATFSGTVRPTTNMIADLGSGSIRWSTLFGRNIDLTEGAIIGGALSGTSATFSSLAGTGTRMVVASSGGLLSTQAIPTGTVTGTGTTNYLPKFTGSTTIGNSIIYDDGAVGIGTLSATAINNASGIANLVVGNGGASPQGITIYTNSSTYGGLNFARATSGGGAYAGYIKFDHTNDSMGFFIGNSPRVTISSSGNLLVGTTTDNGARLQVSGSMTVGSITGDRCFIGQVPSYGPDYTQFSHSSRAGANQYSFLSGNAGDTYVNSVNSQPIYFRHNNVDLAIITSSGSVGIGTPSPSFQLHVNRAGATGMFVSNTSADTGAYLFAGSNLELQAVNSSNSSVRNLTIQPYGGNVLIGTTTDNGARLQVSGGNVTITNSGNVFSTIKTTTNTGVASYLCRNDIDTTTEIGNWGSARAPFGAISANNGYIFSGDELAIGASLGLKFGTGGSNTTRLTISSTGAATFSSSVTAGGDGIFGDNRQGNNAGTTVVNILGSSSSTTSAQLNLTQVWNGLQYPIVLKNIYNPVGGAASSVFTLSTTQWNGSIPLTTERFRIDGNSGAATFSSLGTGTVFSNGGTLTNTNPSDFNLKENIEPINYGLGEILQLNPVTFNWKNDTINQGKQYGFIAQEVQNIMPDLVKKGEYLGLDKEAIFTTLVKAIQELKQEIDTLKN